jgi:hypothetical protein
MTETVGAGGAALTVLPDFPHPVRAIRINPAERIEYEGSRIGIIIPASQMRRCERRMHN